ncbi:MAG: type II secretion system protein GspC [Pseudomonadota bacterium]
MSLPGGNVAAVIPSVLIALLLLLIAAQLAKLTWTLFDSATIDAGIDSEVVTSTDRPAATVIDWNTIPLFGKAEIVKKAAVKKPLARKPKKPGVLKKLDVTLIGAMVSTDPRHSFVSIREGGETRVLKTGEEIKDGVTVKAISPRAFTATDGSAERVFYLIPADELRAKEREAHILQEPEAEVSVEPVSDSQPGAAETVSHQVDDETRVKLEQYRSDLQENPLSLADVVSASPVQRNGELYGYRLRHGKDRELLTSVGLRAGDILMNVNGLAITDPEQLTEVIESLATGAMVDLTIERGGKQRDLNVVLE